MSYRVIKLILLIVKYTMKKNKKIMKIKKSWLRIIILTIIHTLIHTLK